MSTEIQGYGLVVDVLTGKFRVPSDRVSPGATLAGLELDSLALVEFALTLTDRTGVRFTGEEVGADLTLGALGEAVDARLRGDTATAR
ncbi:acyl carrier protein [Streptomyces triculaminicus]|uniref:Acyl carrier protein n=2 Tax=Streptomyces TaxID=1883 RepID=A0A939FWW8_9ACTN|nr:MULTISPECIES: acyl carrier protein [Streptomyces]MBO0657442.1 acyl carrier protein [Streptomyces triculaminicus]MBZ6476195.1 acyl carrier protein [Streptomyces griseocarneus]QSY49563.1 acyl carrier protein [Streptomyces griseocarneus]GHG63464.1 acyl carrier protein [Streptomyces griseocarneus]